MLSKDRNAVHLFAGIGFGLTAGCLVGILYAPEAGKKTRRRLAYAVEDGIDYVASRTQETTESIRKGALRLQNEVSDLLDRGQAVIDKGQAQVESALEKRDHLRRMAAR
jgi:gas vesicle protein